MSKQKCIMKEREIRVTFSYFSICEHKSVRHPFSRSDCKKLSRSTMAEATGPPLPLGNHPNGVDISHPKYAIEQ